MTHKKAWQVLFSVFLILGMLVSSLNLQPVLAADPPTDTGINGSPFVLYEDGLYKMWYSVGEELYYASSTEPDTFSNGVPVVLNGDQPTSKANPAIIREGNLLYMFLYYEMASKRILMYSSSDGVNWSYISHVYKDQKVGWFAQSLGGFEIEHINNQYYLFFEATTAAYDGFNAPVTGSKKVFLATYSGSLADPFNVEDPASSFALVQPGPVLDVDASKGWDSAEIYAPSVVHYGNDFYMWYTATGADGVEKIGLATSPDGIAWTRASASPLMDGSNVMALQHQGRWDTWYQGSSTAQYQSAGVPVGFASPSLTTAGLGGSVTLDQAHTITTELSQPANAFPITSPQVKYTLSKADNSPLTDVVTSSFLVNDPSDLSAPNVEVTPTLTDGKLDFIVPTSASWSLQPSAELSLEAIPTFSVEGSYNLTISLNDTAATPAIQTASTTGELTVSAEVSVAPLIYPIEDKTVIELHLLNFIPTYEDRNDPPHILTFSLSPTNLGATVNSSTGEFRWTPAVGQASVTPYAFTFTACDASTPAQCTDVDFNVTVLAADNTPPSFTYPIADKTIAEETLLLFNIPVEDAEVPPQTLTFTLTPADIGAQVNVNGRFTWTPTEAQGPVAQTFTIQICDNFTPAACISDDFIVNVTEVNLTPVIQPVPEANISPLVEHSFTASASDPDIPAQTLSFSLTGTVPTGAVVDPATGVFTWTPTEAQASATYNFYLCVSDGLLQACTLVKINVGGANLPPELYPIDDDTIPELVEYTFTATASDPDVGQTLSFSLVSAPEGAVIDAVTGVFTWTPTEAQGPGVYSFDVKVCDDGTPSRCATEAVTLTVTESNLPPMLYPIDDDTINEMVEYSFTAEGYDPDRQTMVFSLEGAPTGAVIDAGTGIFTWTPSEAQGPGIYTFTVKVCDNFTPPACDSQEVTLTVLEVNRPPVIDPFPETTIPELVPYSVTFTASDPDLPAQILTWSLSPSAPAGSTIDAGTGVFTWTPTEDQGPGLYQFAVCVYDGVVFGCQNVSFIVTEANQAPVLGTIIDDTIPELGAYSFTASATDGDLPAQTLTFSLINAPAGATIDPSTGVFNWTPTEAQGPGDYPFTVQVCDSFTPQACDSQLVTLTVEEVNLPPSLSPIEDATIWELEDFTFTATASDPDLPAQTLTFSLGTTAPTGAAIDPVTGVFTWTPTADQGPDAYTFDVCVSDGIATVCDSITITVQEGNLPPNLYPIGDETIPEMALYTFTAEASDPNTPAQTLTFSLESAPAGAAIDPSSGVFTWTPTEAQGPGIYPFTVKVCDDQTPALCDSQLVTLTVTEVNLAPILSTIGNKTIPEMTLLSFTATATDPDLPAQSLSFSLGASAPTGASINATTGVFTWTPTEAQGPGSYTFDVCVSDGTLSDCETITVTILEVNLPPVLGPIANATIPELAPFSFTATATDPDLPAQILTFSLLNAPVGATIGATSGVFTWTPTEAQGPGVYTFTVQVCDSATPAACATQAVTLTVTEVNAAPVIRPIGNLSVLEMTLLSHQIAVTDPDLPANPLTYQLISGPEGLTLNPTTGLLTWTPSEAQGFGVYSATVKVCDAGPLCDEETFTITVYEVNRAPAIEPIEDVTIPEEVRFTYQVVASDPDLPAQVLTYSLVAYPAGATIGNLTGEFRWTPTEAQGPGVYTVIVRVCDNYTQPLCATETFVITVEEVPVAPVAVDDAYSMDENTTLTIAAPGVLTNDLDPDSSILVVLLQGEVSTGTLVLHDDGSFEYTPPANFYGEVSFQYKLADGSGLYSNIATVTITVLNAGGEIFFPLIFK